MHAGALLHHVGGGAAHVAVSVMQPRLGDDVFPQIVAAHVHQLGRVQRAAPGEGRARRVGRASLKAVQHARHGKAALPADVVRGAGMPGEHRIHLVEISGAGEKHLSAAVLLSRAAEVFDGGAQAGFEAVVLQRHGCGKAARAQQVVPAAMACRALAKRRFFSAARLLGKRGQRVVFAQKGDDRPFAAPCGDESRLHAAGAALQRKALGLQRGADGGGALRFAPVRLRKAPDGPGQRNGAFLFLFHPFGDALCFIHVFHVLCSGRRAVRRGMPCACKNSQKLFLRIPHFAAEGNSRAKRPPAVRREGRAAGRKNIPRRGAVQSLEINAW